MSNDLNSEIELSNRFGETIQLLVVAKGECPTGDRNKLLIALWSLVFEIQRGILCLIHNKLFGPAQALVRPITEAVIRAHVVIMGSDEDVERILKDNYQTNFKTIRAEIDAAFGTGTLFENFLNEATRDAMHSYTHGGMQQLGRRFQGTDLTPNYSEGELLESVRVSTSAVFLVNSLVTKYFGFEDEWKQNSQLYEEWGKRPRAHGLRDGKTG
jgi:hypothetical protein